MITSHMPNYVLANISSNILSIFTDLILCDFRSLNYICLIYRSTFNKDKQDNTLSTASRPKLDKPIGLIYYTFK